MKTAFEIMMGFDLWRPDRKLLVYSVPNEEKLIIFYSVVENCCWWRKKSKLWFGTNSWKLSCLLINESKKTGPNRVMHRLMIFLLLIKELS